MANYISFTKATFNPYNPKVLNEGQFSWMTSDTGKQIGSERENTIDVYMYDNEGNQWYEKNYEGYGEFGKLDYYELLAKMNGFTEEDLKDKALLKAIRVMGKAEMRDIGIALAFDPKGKKIKTRAKGNKVLFPALVEDPKFNWKRHDFTEEPENDPNQSWYQEPEWDEDDDDYEKGWYENIQPTHEGVMSDIDQMIQKHKSFDSFEKEFFKEYGHKKVMKRTPEFLEWLKALYNDFEYTSGEAVAEARYDKKKLLKLIKNSDDAEILVNGEWYIIYNPDNGNDENTAMWAEDDVIFALTPDGDEKEIKYSDIEKFQESVVKELTWDSLKESLGLNESKKLKIGEKGEDYNNNIVEIIAIGKYKQIAKMFKKEMKSDAADYGYDELMVNTDYYLTKNVEATEGNVGDFAIYPVRYDMANYWGLDEVDESKVHEAKLSAIHKAAKKGSYPVSIVVFEYTDSTTNRGKVVKQELVKTPAAVPAVFNELKKEYPNAIISVESKTGQTLFSESVELHEGRSINKISKDHAATVADMAKTVGEWKSAEGDRKTELLELLRELNKRKAELETELDNAVAGKDRNIQLALDEAEELAYLDIELNKIFENEE